MCAWHTAEIFSRVGGDHIRRIAMRRMSRKLLLAGEAFGGQILQYFPACSRSCTVTIAGEVAASGHAVTNFCLAPTAMQARYNKAANAHPAICLASPVNPFTQINHIRAIATATNVPGIAVVLAGAYDPLLRCCVPHQCAFCNDTFGKNFRCAPVDQDDMMATNFGSQHQAGHVGLFCKSVLERILSRLERQRRPGSNCACADGQCEHRNQRFYSMDKHVLLF